MLEAPNNRVLITGATPGVGKSFVSANFAALMAGAGKRTLLIDADLRKGHLHQYFGLQRQGGLSELIAGSLSRQWHPPEVVPNLDFLATGTLPPNPAELLVSVRSEPAGAAFRAVRPGHHRHAAVLGCGRHVTWRRMPARCCWWPAPAKRNWAS